MNYMRKTMKYTNLIRTTVKYKLTRITVYEKPCNIQTDKMYRIRKTMKYTNRI